MIRKFKEFLFDNKRDIQERLFLLITVIALSGMALSFILSVINGENTEGIISMVFAFIIMTVVVYFGVKYNRIRLAATIVAVVIVFVFFPVVFFTSGGIYGGTPIWFVFAILYTSMILRSRVRIVLLSSQFIVAGVCYYIGFYYPQLVISHSTTEFYGDSFSSFAVVSLIMTLMITFEVYMLRRETRTVRQQKEEIDELNKAQNHFFSSMSHEIRTPINTIVGLNEMILREDVSPEVEEDARNIQAASRMLLSLINDILDMSKIQSGQMKINPVNYNCAEMITEVASMIQIRAMEKKLSFNVNIAPDLPRELYGDEIRIKQVLINILNNAVKYTNEGSVSLSIQCEKINDGKVNVIYSVEDTGMGIKKENIPYLFNAFKRVDEDKNRHIEGTGLGLSIVKEFVGLMNGKVTVNSVYTMGSTFIVEIPQAVMDPRPIERLDMYGRGETSDTRSYHQSFEAPDARILVVDDTAANLLVIKKLLRDTQVKLDTASGGEEALELTLKNDYHVIFMDHMMPGIDGIECMKRIRSQTGGYSRESKIVALTANADEKSRLLYEKEGFDGYVLKPVSGNILETELRRLLPKELIKFEVADENVLEESVSWINQDAKKTSIKVIMSSVADTPREFVDEYKISVVPLKVQTEGGCFRDGVDMDSDAILSYMGARKKKARILPVSPREYEKYFADELKRANNIIYIASSGKLYTSSVQGAFEASVNFNNVRVVDSEQISSGQGLMAVEACRMAKKGKGIEEILEYLERFKKQIHTSFLVENVDYMMESGLISSGIARILKAFFIRPVLVLKKGRVKVQGICMGSREHSCKRFIAGVLRNKDHIDKRMLVIAHVGVSRNDLDWIRSVVEKHVAFEKIYFTKASPAIAINVGLGSFGLIYRTKD